MKLVRSCIPVFLFLLVFGCEESNEFLVVEEELPFQPEVILYDENLLNYRLAEEPLYDDEGYGVVFSDSASDTKIYVVASGEVVCKGNGTSEFSIANDPDPFFITFFGNEEAGYTVANAQFHPYVNGDRRIAFLFSKDTTDPCEVSSPSVTVDRVSDDRIQGSVTGTAFSWDPTREKEDGEEFCEILESIGPFTAEFSISLNPCSL